MSFAAAGRSKASTTSQHKTLFPQNTSGFVVYAHCCYLLVYILSLHRTLIHPLAGFHAESARSFLALPYFKLLQFHLRDKVGTTTAPPVVTDSVQSDQKRLKAEYDLRV